MADQPPWEKFKSPSKVDDSPPWEKFSNEKPQDTPMVSKEGLKQGFINALPAAGGVIGGVAGSALGPFGAVGGAGLGAAGGQYIKQMIQPPELKSEGFLPRQAEMAQEPAKEAAYAAGGEMTGPVVGKLAEKAAPALSKYANFRKVKQLGGLKKGFDELQERGIVQPLGEQMFEDKIGGPFTRPKGMSEQLESKMGGLDQDLADTIQATQTGREMAKHSGLSDQDISKIESTTFRPKDVAENLKSQVMANNKQIPQKKLQPALDEIDDWLSDKPETMTIGDVQDFKKSFNKFLKTSDFYSSNPGIKKEGMIAVRRALMKSVEDQSNAISETMGGDVGRIKELNKKYSNYITAQDIAEDAVSRQNAHRGLSLTDYLAMVGGGAMGHSPLEHAGSAVAMGTANKLGRTYGSGVLAHGAKNLSGIAEGAGGLLGQPGVGAGTFGPAEQQALDRYMKRIQEKQ